MHISKYKANAGYTVVELVMAVTVAGVISTGVLIVGNYIWAEQKADDFGKRMEYVVGSVEDFFNSRTNYSQLNITTAAQLGFLQFERVVPASVSALGVQVPAAAFHIYNNPMSLGSLTGASFNKLAWGLHYAQLPPDSCVTITIRALHIGDAVALAPDPSRFNSAGSLEPTTKIEDWAPNVSWSAGAVSGFLTPYEILKKSKGESPGVSEIIAACNIATKLRDTGAREPYALAIIRTRL